MTLLLTAVDVERPVDEVWAAWADLEALPTRFRSVVDARMVDDDHLAVVAKIAGEARTWTAEVTERVECDRIAWRAIDGPRHRGAVSFHELGPAATRVVVQLDWEPQGTFEQVGDRLGIVRRALDADLARFKAELEAAGGGATSLLLAGDGRARGDRGGARLAQADRGRQAEAPQEIPKRGWKDVLKRTFKEAKVDNVPILAAGVAFFTFLALVPGLVALVSVYGIVREASEVGELVESLSTVPAEVRALLDEQLRKVAETSETSLSIALGIGLAAALWSASKGMKALIEAVNITFDEQETRKFLKLRGLALLLTLGALVMLVATIFVLVVVPNLLEDEGAVFRVTMTIVRWPLLALGMMVALAVLYRFAPDRDNPRWRWVTPGAVVATVLWLVGSAVFSIYASSFGKFNETYGTLGATVVLLLWLYLTAYVVLIGAELNAETERQTARDSTVGRERPMGTRRAAAADEIGPAMG